MDEGSGSVGKLAAMSAFFRRLAKVIFLLSAINLAVTDFDKTDFVRSASVFAIGYCFLVWSVTIPIAFDGSPSPTVYRLWRKVQKAFASLRSS